MLAVVFWLTIAGANVPSAMLAQGSSGSRISRGRPLRLAAARPGGSPASSGTASFAALAWVISVMLPPMAIFFPLFTILEDLGLPAAGRVQSRLPVQAAPARTASRR